MAIFDSFSPEVVRALLAADWSQDRRVDISLWEQVLRGEGYFLSPLAKEVLESLGSLRVKPVRQSLYSADLLFEPELAGSGAYDIAEEFESMFHQRFYPIAEWISNSCVFLGENGKVVSYDDIELLDIADDFGDALDVMLLAVRSPRVLRSAQ